MHSLLISVLLCLSSSLWAQSTPVYLQPNSPAATGHFDRALLQKQSIEHDHYEWLWVQDNNGHAGWVLKDAALLPLDFSRRAVLGKGEAVYPAAKNFLLPQKTLNEAQIVTLVKRKRDWYKIIYLEGTKKFYGWVRSRYLSPYSKDAGYFFSTVDTYLRDKPQTKSNIIKNIGAGLPIIPLNTKGQWAYVEYDGKKGYLPMKNLKSRIDVALRVRTRKGYFQPHPSLYKEKVLEIFSNPLWVGTGAYTVELKEKPEMGSRTIHEIKPWQSMVLQGYSIKKWGKSYVPRWGELWWPDTTVESNVELIETLSPKWTRLRVNETYKIEKSPVVPGLRFASTKRGVFRSFDGKSWYPMKDFKHGYPIKVTENGTLFVGDKVSFDHGESFQHYIRWDRVFDSIPQLGEKGPLQIVAVSPHPKQPQKVTLSLRLGKKKRVQVYTSDLGKNWRRLK